MFESHDQQSRLFIQFVNTHVVLVFLFYSRKNTQILYFCFFFFYRTLCDTKLIRLCRIVPLYYTDEQTVCQIVNEISTNHKETHLTF